MRNEHTNVEGYMDIDGEWNRLWTITIATYSSEFLQMEACLGHLDVSSLSYSTEHHSRPSNPNHSVC